MTERIFQHVPAERVAAGQARFAEAIRVAEISGDHVWIALIQHLINNPAEIGDGMIFDADSLVGNDIGCFRCEEPYSPRLVHRRCPGEPKR